MSSPQQQNADPVALLTTIVTNLDKRLTKIERIVWTSAGAAAGASGGTWVTILMTRR